MVDVVALGFAAGLVAIVAALHFARGTGWEPTTDVSDELLEARASTVEDPGFPEPGNRAIGGGGAVAGAVTTGEEDAELEDGETEEQLGPADIPDEEVEYFDVEFVKEGETIELANNETILEQGEEHGWDLPYACRQGQCVSCSGQIVDGPAEDYVVHDNQQMLDDNELEEGYTLTCVAYPKADFSIETGEAP